MNPANDLFRSVLIFKRLYGTTSMLSHPHIMSKKFEVPIIADLAGDEEKFVTEFDQGVLVSLIKLSVAIANLLSKRLDMSVSVRHERNVKSFQGIIVRVYPRIGSNLRNEERFKWLGS
ncbi:hypothetical protein C488_06780 [Natrinema pellirubrum DSM 15624]|uniref:Uncharacterized protein n=1 Tax=Natrinema pellirubrum (strain DSM 15624 / CIP 106293 / JCM 10476 / NCIMB 786 / 157) TaxID=797303 RepID=L9YUJ5_NATP1|nr:hypothetical protein C488_06780 [Natrinema pellirubrum DSM 15624]